LLIQIRAKSWSGLGRATQEKFVGPNQGTVGRHHTYALTSPYPTRELRNVSRSAFTVSSRLSRTMFLSGRIIAADVSQRPWPLGPWQPLQHLQRLDYQSCIRFKLLNCKTSRRSHLVLRVAFRAATGQGISDALMHPWPSLLLSSLTPLGDR
jgi:hypothetical protein